jgi:TetR/AcrR family transcriptional regulator, transcriptional repressor for nem operon
MPRVSREVATRHRVAIERASARLFRERGLGASVADVMAAAGLTHGGFYGHFASKSALEAVALERAMDEATGRWRRRVAERAPGVTPLAAIVAGYLSTRSRGAVGSGCPTAALANDVARAPRSGPVRKAYAKGVRRQLAILDEARDDDAGDANLVRLATMVGALALARALEGDALSDDVLRAAATALAANA